MQRFLGGSQDTSHFVIIPVLGYSDKCLISAMTSQKGEPWGEQGPARGVLPSPAVSPVLIASDGEAADAPAVVPTAISAATY